MTQDIDAQCSRIVEKLMAAAAADPALAVFGANSHKYAIGPTVSEKDLHAFETRHGIDLPPHYRAFLKQVGNGAPDAEDGAAAGPFYGIYPLGIGVDGERDHLGRLPVIRPDMSPSEWEATKPLHAEDASDLWGGLLFIGHQGCQSYHALVVQGPHAGRVVNIDTELNPPRFAFETNFLDWYERWLDEILSGILLKEGPTWFGYSLGGDDRHLLNVFRQAGNKDAKLEALRGFGKLTSISPESADELSGIAASDEPELRQKAIMILAEFAHPQARQFLEALLKGSEEDQLTACQAIHWYAKDHADDWIDLVGPIAVVTDNIELFQHATFFMVSSGRDCSRYLLAAASHPDHAMRSLAIYAIGKGVKTPLTIDAILKALADDSPKVVHAALQAHKEPFDDRFIEAYAAIADRYKVDEYYIHANLEHRLRAIGYKSIRAFVADFAAKKARRQGFWSRLFGRRS